jgi:hypothetical protein
MKYSSLLFFSSILFFSVMFSQEKQNLTTYKLKDGVIYKTTDKTTWQTIPTSEAVQLLAWHPERTDMFLAVTKNVLYRVFAQSNMWYPVLSRGENFTPVQVKHAKLKWWEVWLVGTTEEESGGKHTELWSSNNGGATWRLVQYLNIPAEEIELEPDTAKKYRIANTKSEQE